LASSTDLLRPHPNASLDESLEALPVRARRLLSAAVSQLCKLPSERRARAIAKSLTTPMSSATFDAAELAEAIEVSEEDASYIANGITFLAALIAAFDDKSTQELIESLSKHGFVTEDSQSIAGAWIDELKEHSAQFKVELDQSSIANEVLPSLTSFKLALDLRVGKTTDGVNPIVPVAVGFLDTDGEGQCAWFQMTKPQVKWLQQQFTELVERFERAEQLVAKLKSSQS
jgi:hypothetical protein